MYASLSTSHFTLSEEPNVGTHLTQDDVSIACHLSNNLYVSFRPDEARRFAAKLVEVAAQAEVAQARINALDTKED